MLRRIYHLLIKEFLQALRDPRMRFVIFLPPLVQLMIYGYAVNFDIKHIRAVVFDESRTFESRKLIRHFAAGEYFDLDFYADHEKQVRDLIDRSKVTFALHLPWDFAKQVKAGKAGP